MSRSRSAPALLRALRVLGAVLLFVMAAIHLFVWLEGYRDIEWIGPLFLLNVVAGVLLGLAVLVTPRWWLTPVAVLGALLQAGTLGGLMLSRCRVGIFGFLESTSATLFWPSVFVEVAGAAVLAELAAGGAHPVAAGHRSARPGLHGLMRTRGDGGESGLRALYDAHALALLGYAVRLCDGDRARAEDLVQETLVRAWRHLDVLDPSAARCGRGCSPSRSTWPSTPTGPGGPGRPRWGRRRSRPCRPGRARGHPRPDRRHGRPRVAVAGAPGGDRRDVLPGADASRRRPGCSGSRRAP